MYLGALQTILMKESSVIAYLAIAGVLTRMEMNGGVQDKEEDQCVIILVGCPF